MNEVWLVDETVLELSERRRFLVLGLLLFAHKLSSGSTHPNRRLLFDSLCMVGLDALQIHLLHSLQFNVRLRVTACALAELTKFVVLIKVEL